MPFVYTSTTKSVADTFTTSGTASTEIDFMSIKPGVRNVNVVGVAVLGRGAGLTSLSGIAFHLKRWTTTQSSGGTGVTPAPADPDSPSAKATVVAASAGVTSGTGGPTIQAMFGCGGASPGGWSAYNADAPKVIDGGSTTQSLDLFVESGTASLSYEAALEHFE